MIKIFLLKFKMNKALFSCLVSKGYLKKYSFGRLWRGFIWLGVLTKYLEILIFEGEDEG